MKEIVVISGKGGTGKTTVTASLAYLAENKVMVDCDVDAADLHLILHPEIQYTEDFDGGAVAEINYDLCTYCGKCFEVCRFDAISEDIVITPYKCDGCSVCEYFCPTKAIEMKPKIAGQWFISDTKYGPFVHAKLNIAEDNSGKLITKIRDEAKKIAKEKNLDLIISDGSPGIGCPVISSITGATVVLIVVEPTVSGISDLERVGKLLNHFKIDGKVCVNKYDINEEKYQEIIEYSEKNNLEFIGEIPFDTNVNVAQVDGKSIVEFKDSVAGKSIREIWKKLQEYLK